MVARQEKRRPAEEAMIKPGQDQMRPEITTGLEEMKTTVRQPRKGGGHSAGNGGLSRRDGDWN
jgi:hypothetical protein